MSALPITALDFTQPRLPLYLVSPSPCVIHASDGALLLRNRNLAARRFPLAAVSRIVSSVAHAWHGAALALCLSSNIPVVFLDGSRGPAGWLLPRDHTAVHLRQLIEEALCLPSWSNIYSNWLRAERNRVVSSWPSRSAEEVPLHQIQAWRKRFVYQQADDPSASIPPLWGAAVDSLVLRILTDAGLPAIFHACDGDSLQLARDCAALACLHLFPDAANPLGAGAPDNAFLLRCFEARTETLRGRLITALLRLHRLFSQGLSQWH